MSLAYSIRYNITMESSSSTDTFYAPAERASIDQIKIENEIFKSERLFIEVLNAMSGTFIVLNGFRQIVYANEGLMKLLDAKSESEIIGKRPGEALGCIHANETPAGCGTSESCKVCGAVNAIINSQQTQEKSIFETRITTSTDDFLVSWDMLVTSSPLTLSGTVFYLLTLSDLSNEKRRQNLERIFFHDILNSAGSLNGLLSIARTIDDPGESKKILETSEEVSQELIDEIVHHRQLRSAENGDLQVNLDLEKASDMLTLAASKVQHHPVGEGKHVITEDHSEGLTIETDRVLLQRILINMIKNALEATPVGGSITASVWNKENHVIYTVHNDAVIPRDYQLQIFQRSFSTKGGGRGIGTYSIKMLTENYLKGKAGFVSRDPDGTVFWIEIPVKGTPAR